MRKAVLSGEVMFPFAIPSRMRDAYAMKRFVIAAIVVLGVATALAEPRVFTNAEGKTMTAELVSVNDDKVVFKLANANMATVPLKSLSAEDQAYIAEWWKVNKDKLKPMDVTLTIAKKADRVDRKVTRSGGGNARPGQNVVSEIVKKLTVDEFHYVGELKSYVKKDISDISITYTIYKRVSTSGKAGADTKVEKISGEALVKRLEAYGKATFETDIVSCEDSSVTGGNAPREYKRETILGVVFDLSSGGEHFLKQSAPENLIETLEQNER
jgi:hypothetical protein